MFCQYTSVRILVIGASGQDGSMVAETYANSGHHVIGVTSKPVKSLHSQIEMLNIDFAKSEDARSLLQKFLPHRIYNLAAVHSSSTSSVQPNLHIRDSMYRCNVEITQNILEWQREEPSCKAVIALSSQMYSGHKGKQSINEESEFSPQNYYAQTKVQGFNLLREFRELYDTQTFGAILFNHTSSRSKGEFLFPQLVHQLKAVLKGESSKISLKNPDFKIDVCHASEVTHAMMQMIELKEA
jgi:GDP-D-mannose dehydratase